MAEFTPKWFTLVKWLSWTDGDVLWQLCGAGVAVQGGILMLC